MDILSLQKFQLSRDTNLGTMLDASATPTFLAELSMFEGDHIPFVVRTGPISKPDPGILKNYEAVEINGEGRAFVMVWIQNRLVAWGTLIAQEGPKRVRRLAIPRGLGHGYDIDLFIAFQGRMTGYEVFWEPVGGEDE